MFYPKLAAGRQQTLTTEAFGGYARGVGFPRGYDVGIGGVVADAYLPQLDSCAEHRSQILYQLTEVNASIRRKIKQKLIIVKGVLRIDQLHFQSMLCDFFLADGKGLLFLFPVALDDLLIFLRRDADNRFQRLDHFIVLHLLRRNENRSHLHAAGGFHDDVHRHLQLIIQRIKIVDLARSLESNSYNFYHD